MPSQCHKDVLQRVSGFCVVGQMQLFDIHMYLHSSEVIDMCCFMTIIAAGGTVVAAA